MLKYFPESENPDYRLEVYQLFRRFVTEGDGKQTAGVCQCPSIRGASECTGCSGCSLLFCDKCIGLGLAGKTKGLTNRPC